MYCWEKKSQPYQGQGIYKRSVASHPLWCNRFLGGGKIRPTFLRNCVENHLQIPAELQEDGIRSRTGGKYFTTEGLFWIPNYSSTHHTAFTQRKEYFNDFKGIATKYLINRKVLITVSPSPKGSPAKQRYCTVTPFCQSPLPSVPFSERSWLI